MTSPSGAQRLESDRPARTDPPADPALEALLAITQELSGTLEIEQAFARALDIVQRVLGAARASIALVDEPPGDVSVGGPVGDGVDEDALVRVPILTGERSVGELSVLLRHEEQRNLPAITQVLRIVSAVVAQRLRLELRERYDYANIIGKSGAMRVVHEQIAEVAATSTTVLIHGESGTGKELIAHAIHRHSRRATGPFVKVSCAALPETSIESELFGHEEGAFTGAHARRKGRFELADGGTLFLDEIGALPLSTQAKLLRVIRERALERVGGSETIEVDVRLVAATTRGSFREDLYDRLDVFSVFAPPLRDRKSDIMLLADHFVAKYAATLAKSIERISTPAIDMLTTYHWPGNVRELENTIERAVIACDGSVVHAHHLPPSLQTADASGTAIDVSLAEAVGNYERSLIEDALKSTYGNRAKAARLLRTTERILAYKAKAYGIDASRYRRRRDDPTIP